LTPRQREVLQLVAEGKSLKEIAAILHISVRTVEFHKTGIMEELGLRTTAELTRYALDQGIAGI
jgi:DNA-binding CsgD family transcriptional regulator